MTTGELMCYTTKSGGRCLNKEAARSRCEYSDPCARDPSYGEVQCFKLKAWSVGTRDFATVQSGDHTVVSEEELTGMQKAHN